MTNDGPSNTVPIILLVVGIILIIAGGALVGIYAHEEFDKKNAQTHHPWMIAGGSVLILVGLGMAIFGLVKISKNNKAKQAVGAGTPLEDAAANPDAPDSTPILQPNEGMSSVRYRGMDSIPSPPRMPMGYYPPPDMSIYQPAPPPPTPYGMMGGYGMMPNGYGMSI